MQIQNHTDMHRFTLLLALCSIHTFAFAQVPEIGLAAPDAYIYKHIIPKTNLLTGQTKVMP